MNDILEGHFVIDFDFLVRSGASDACLVLGGGPPGTLKNLVNKLQEESIAESRISR